MKKVLKTIGLLLLHAAILLVVLVNKYCFDMNETVTMIVAAVYLILLQLWYRSKTKEQKGKSVTFKRIALIAADAVIYAGVFLAVLINPYWNASSRRMDCFRKQCDGDRMISRKEALEDFDYAMKYLNRVHPLTMDGMSPEVEAKAEQARKNLSEQESVPTYELSREIESVFALLGDGHTHSDEEYAEPHYLKYNYEMRQAGYTLVGINGERFEDFLKNHPGLVSYETESYGIRLLKSRISTLEGLRYLGIDTDGEITFDYISKDGEPAERVVTAEDFLTLEEVYDYVEAATGEDIRPTDEKRDFVYYEIDEENSLAVLTLDECNYNAFYRKTVAEMFREVEEKGIRNVVVDLRNNGGGSSLVADEFISYLDTETYKTWASEWRFHYFILPIAQSVETNRQKDPVFDGNVYVMTSVVSYSAAMDFAMLIQDNGLGTIVGEPCGNLPASYGDVVQYRLPNSGIYMQVSMKGWHRVDTSKEGLPLLPDIDCPAEEALEKVTECCRPQADTSVTAQLQTDAVR
ncbi:MAG: hypothetical protein IKH46_03340 [Lachnospiraceae bacterium]|nr:hypothetical protein [Lachnospiraceae bacterium]